MLNEYESKHIGKDLFFSKWLNLFFFEALNTPFNQKEFIIMCLFVDWCSFASKSALEIPS